MAHGTLRNASQDYPLLEAQGYKRMAPPMAFAPSPDDSSLPVDSKSPAIQATQQPIIAETSVEADVVLIGHSSGSIR